MTSIQAFDNKQAWYNQEISEDKVTQNNEYKANRATKNLIEKQTNQEYEIKSVMDEVKHLNKDKRQLIRSLNEERKEHEEVKISLQDKNRELIDTKNDLIDVLYDREIFENGLLEANAKLDSEKQNRIIEIEELKAGLTKSHQTCYDCEKFKNSDNHALISSLKSQLNMAYNKIEDLTNKINSLHILYEERVSVLLKKIRDFQGR